MTKVLVCDMGCAPYEHDVPMDPWDFTKGLIGEESLIQIITLEDGVLIYCDEEALMKGLKVNRTIPARAPDMPPGVDFVAYLGDPSNMAKAGEYGIYQIRGPFILTRHDYEHDAPLSLSDDDVRSYMAFFDAYCAFCGVNRKAYSQAIYCGAACSVQAGA